jgi:hypothetical protein
MASGRAPHRRNLTGALWMSSERSVPRSFVTCRQRAENGQYALWQGSSATTFEPSFVINRDRIHLANAARKAMDAGGE